MCSFEGTGKESAEKEIILDSSMVEHSAVNRVVAGSSPARGVREAREACGTDDVSGGSSGAWHRRGFKGKASDRAPWSSG